MLNCATSRWILPSSSLRSGYTRKGQRSCKLSLKIFRFNPEKDEKPHYETYTLDAEPNDRVLDLLEHVKGYIDGSLTFRRSCAHGVCGSDAMRINGRNRLACKVLVKDLEFTRNNR